MGNRFILMESFIVLICFIDIRIRTSCCFKKILKHREISSVLCDHLEGWDRDGGRERQEGGHLGLYVYV